MDNPSEKAKKNQRLMEKSKKLYVEDLGGQLQLLEKLLTQLQQHFDMEDAHYVYHIVHKMKGSAPIFGLVRTGKVAEELVHLWEWTQLKIPQEPSNAVYLKKSLNHLLQLKIEYGICVKEMELDELEQKSSQNEQYCKGCLLLIDDDHALRSYLLGKFGLAGYQVHDAADVETAKRKLHENQNHYDAILLDLMMYPQSGYELFEFLKEDPTLKWIPLIVLSGREDIEDKVRCLQLGADDYVTKPFHYEELEARINRLLQRSKQFEQIVLPRCTDRCLQPSLFRPADAFDDALGGTRGSDGMPCVYRH